VVEPVAEVCGSSGAAQDEDCDGNVDNGCTCDAGDMQDCYMGPVGTLGVGVCASGTQECDTGTNTFGPCDDDVLPSGENCSNEGADDDCNGTEDDIRSRGDPCSVPDAKGVCRDGTFECGPSAGTSSALTCVGPESSTETCNDLDDDCDGSTDEGLIGTDKHCSACEKSCDDGTACCGGECVDVTSDSLNCGRCRADCGALLACCDGRCTNTQSDPMNCNGCGRVCNLGGCCQSGACSNVVFCF
jgi:hypothetical protein